ncbi:MAG: hypothetical protein F6J97_18385 [Leptolyngbya sp. SIO4C1]|nr:hypothetical protein [Leptolyngbya sp. SIO4C1]
MAFLATAAPGHAANLKVSAKASGLDSGFNRISDDLDSFLGIPITSFFFGSNDFFEISVEGGPADASVKSITLDLTETRESESDAYFDPIDLGFDATPEVGQTLNIDESDITFSEVARGAPNAPLGPSTLTASFAPGSFGAGSAFTFGADTNSVGSDFFPFLIPFEPFFEDPVSEFNDTGADFGIAGIRFLVELESGETGAALFEQTGLLSSTAMVSFSLPGENVSSGSGLVTSGETIESLLGNLTGLLEGSGTEAEIAALVDTIVDGILSDVDEDEIATLVDGLVETAIAELGEAQVNTLISLITDGGSEAEIADAIALFTERIHKNRDGGGDVSVPEPATVLGLIAAALLCKYRLKRVRPA